MQSFSNTPSRATDLKAPSLTPWTSQVVAITGTVGSGKSKVIELLKKHGAFVVSADDLAHDLVMPGTDGLKEITARFGVEVLNADGTLNRAELRHKIFSDPTAKHDLEAILHPRIQQRAGELFNEAIRNGATRLFYEIPLLFETRSEKRGFKKIVVITVDDEVCIQRAMKRDGISRSEAEQRLHSQMPTELKRQKADIVIDNSGTIEALEAQIAKL